MNQSPAGFSLVWALVLSFSLAAKRLLSAEYKRTESSGELCLRESKDLEDEEFTGGKAGFLSGETKTFPTSSQNTGHAN